MEIKELVKRLNEFKQQRNLLELKIDDFIEVGKKAAADVQKEIDNKDRMGLVGHVCQPEAFWEDLNKGIGQLEYGVKYINEGIAILEASYRRAIRFKETEEVRNEKTSDEAK